MCLLGFYRHWLNLLGGLKRFDDAVAIALHVDRIPFLQRLYVHTSAFGSAISDFISPASSFTITSPVSTLMDITVPVIF